MSNPRFTIAQLRSELMELAESVSGYAPPPKPDRFVTDRGEDNGPVWHVQQTLPKGREHAALAVRCVDGDPGVFVEGADFSMYGDWHGLSTGEARSFAMALLAAADWSDGQDIVGQRRARKANSS